MPYRRKAAINNLCLSVKIRVPKLIKNSAEWILISSKIIFATDEHRCTRINNINLISAIPARHRSSWVKSDSDEAGRSVSQARRSEDTNPLIDGGRVECNPAERDAITGGEN